jgi:hypothetical protein
LKCQILFSQSIAYQKTIETAFQIPKIINVAGEVPASCRKNARLSNLASQLKAKTLLPGDCC